MNWDDMWDDTKDFLVGLGTIILFPLWLPFGVLGIACHFISMLGFNVRVNYAEQRKVKKARKERKNVG